MGKVLEKLSRSAVTMEDLEEQDRGILWELYLQGFALKRWDGIFFLTTMGEQKLKERTQ
jgi:hypothetical protein